jgi:hypothetical protein
LQTVGFPEIPSFFVPKIWFQVSAFQPSRQPKKRPIKSKEKLKFPTSTAAGLKTGLPNQQKTVLFWRSFI